MESHSPIITKTIQFVKDELANQDGSHDFHHIHRVWATARSLAKSEGVEDIEIVELAALLHDIQDWKYSGSETAGVEAARSWLHSQGYDPLKTEKIAEIIEGVSFKNELARKITSPSRELAVVQDADRLDAIGAIGIARTFTYGGAKKRPLYDPEHPYTEEISKEQYMDQTRPNPTVNHFYEKLFKLKDMMKTESGRHLAEERHKFMEMFLDQFYAEWDGKK
eukprot:TRINITY_DN3360_c0_g1_i2.p1 TRINITY_DN3360_c0_g1~~TRINITY_DN3360_c0_g1_i2.p1  ORF type:complete len:222 (-),score=37.11 TRINITY_DN3360_c0_g1_i2:154-819(-)